MNLSMLDELLKTLDEAQKYLPPWAKYRGKYELCIMDALPPTMMICKFGDEVQDHAFAFSPKPVFIARHAYQLVKAQEWGPLGCPDDRELAAFFAYQLEPKS